MTASAFTSGTNEGGSPEAADLDQRLAALIGQPVGGRGVATGPDAVNMPMIRHWAAAFEDANPAYVNPELAAGSRWGGIVAPPLMLQTWTMPTPMITGMAERGGVPTVTEGTSGLAVLDEAGYTATLATNSEFEITRYLRPGDEVTASTVFEAISPEKTTRMGRGRFVTWVTTYTDAHGNVVGRQRFTILKFDPSSAAS